MRWCCWCRLYKSSFVKIRIPIPPFFLMSIQFTAMDLDNTRPYTRRASPSRHSTSSRGERRQSQFEENFLSSNTLRALGDCKIGEYVYIFDSAVTWH